MACTYNIIIPNTKKSGAIYKKEFGVTLGCTIKLNVPYRTIKISTIQTRYRSNDFRDFVPKPKIIEDDTNNDLLMTDIMKDDFREQIDKQPDELVDYENSDVDFEAILDEELGLN
ncbi:hypothetical protein RhiirA5_410356 [Rhizophagus irregularis]|uniref:Uncharacterized protein n=1 Tax=Rhizophagus irregularis TaxID=588596 RepID=A0A2I1DWZ4_9GLOM|nr:hypothetical protein RhiirA5_410356 [Rhizophagus irregularis]PKC74216.1 hypothetical protein RhiirA1_529790 [Rhizophagus irregularis]PKY14385.1 hypothetical protein RhiirB3_519577 [Rhizophagus irregularis]CAB4471537.1 unnamed protein product [Rhizophagus irregularis]CAB5198583.1 unnamed protein product [Rhizophagus irregularis]